MHSQQNDDDRLAISRHLQPNNINFNNKFIFSQWCFLQGSSSFPLYFIPLDDSLHGLIFHRWKFFWHPDSNLYIWATPLQKYIRGLIVGKTDLDISPILP